MQRIAPNTVPPRQSGGGSNNSGQGGSPALVMGRRIRAEQGVERARQYLMAMEPFVAPAERAHIAQQLGIQLPTHQEPRYAEPINEPQDTGFSQPNIPNFGNANMNGMPNFPGMGNNNLMQMMQMMNAFSGMQGGKGKMDPMLMAQMLGSMMGGKK
ncbi:MAG TPA: hypothetical protein VN512_11260 [Clostridia bacterium]|nr:hypothetical protein [Clostridia bacterium]